MFGKKTQGLENQYYKDFREKSYEELEQEVDAAYSKELRIRFVKIFLVCILLAFVFRDVLAFWWKFGLPQLSKQKTDSIVNVIADPTYDSMVDYDEDGEAIIKDETFEYLTLEDQEKVLLKRRYKASVSGCVVAKNFLFWGNYMPNGKRVFQSTALFDLGLAWGKLANEKVLKDYEFYSQKDKLARTLHSSLKFGVKRPPLPWPYVKTHLAHIHIVPANSRIMNALIYLRKYEPVKLEGFVVDVQVEGRRWIRSFVSRGDVHMARRVREIMYVTRVQIGNTVVE